MRQTIRHARKVAASPRRFRVIEVAEQLLRQSDFGCRSSLTEAVCIRYNLQRRPWCDLKRSAVFKGGRLSEWDTKTGWTGGSPPSDSAPYQMDSYNQSGAFACPGLNLWPLKVLGHLWSRNHGCQESEELLKTVNTVDLLRNQQIGPNVYPGVPAEYTNRRDEQQRGRKPPSCSISPATWRISRSKARMRVQASVPSVDEQLQGFRARQAEAVLVPVTPTAT